LAENTTPRNEQARGSNPLGRMRDESTEKGTR